MVVYAALCSENDPAWVSQLELSQGAVKRKMISSGVTLMMKTGVEVIIRIMR